MHVLLELRKQSLKNICDAFKKEHDEDNVNDQVLEEFNKKRQRDEEELNDMCMVFQRELATSTGRRINRLRKETIWWGITHPSLSDTSHIDDIRREVKESTFKEYYHIILSTFKTLMNILLGTEPYRRCDESELACSVWKQVAVVLWRFSNTHLGYRIAKDKFGCSHGSYNNFTDQFILAMSSIIITGFRQPTKNGKQRLKEVIDAMNGKLISIEKPTTANSDDSYADCKENISINLTTVCDYKKTFIHIATSTPGCRSKNQETVPLTPEQKLYNAVQSRTQQKIENTFSLLVLRRKFLYKHLYVKDVESLTQAIMVCCVLHNLYNEDGAVFGLGEEDNTNPVMFEKVLNTLLARLKTGGEQQQLAVMNSL
ncbi:hypothetical protein PHYBLDRAFT_175501 [Phycomyces blakesleeanus NRRL 1555(-)]|uniref:DDE Tnp4 domain-containing protein n=1 Tax=Phycomyces blakesleeanus (strain ATCC 8743b / DSM 1359 / FGSC 10004 / NBRC 33097 / NRRL 1555) TaxID=763407 RepID=A0A167JKW6_PHYB8|nr:hypothetical protein PHYBLDRAFT_175501 [Phycomyces blakesleeanus NRRL 1555(-)]OAD66207.1 hypothetical protein PHYBLDRAFT_175501 [Phycomyces blakesleeanus NRRL 1555(-)]|eukprot:XP_018284247.1 hypothetical protein PHYBLDRAFT_175501 [Phycomyces blakesleeanus NRRL 1555(-)]